MTDISGRALVELVANVMGTGFPPAQAARAGEVLKASASPFLHKARSEAIRGRAGAGYQLEISALSPDTIARAGEGDETAMRVLATEQRFKAGKRTSRSSALDGPGMQKGRRTEIEFLNGLWCARARSSASCAARCPR